MITINLEKSLIRENRKLAMPKELLLINEYDKFTTLAENDALSRIGLNRTLREGKHIKERINQNLEQIKSFAQERVFHISQIKGICEKYRLRFLQARKYKGVIDNELPNRILNFEIAYNLKCTEYNTLIVAPIENFKLEKKPKNPLMFYKINDEYFYLIHKWGNDLSLSRAIMPLFESGLFCFLFVQMVVTLLFLVNIKLGAAAIMISFSFSIMVQAAYLIIGDKLFTFLKPNEWNSEYE